MPVDRAPRATYVYMRGVRVDVGVRISTWDEHGMQFVSRPRTQTRAVITHMTGAENPVPQMYRNMQSACVFEAHGGVVKRVPAPKSVHFCVDQRGDIYQLADTEMRGAHAVGHGGARSANSWSIGIEFIGRGADLRVSSRGFARDRVRETIHGQLVEYDELFPAQVASGVRLLRALTRLYGLPMKVPEGKDGDVLSEVLSDHEYESFRGVLAHPHVERGKTDISLRLMRAVRAAVE